MVIEDEIEKMKLEWQRSLHRELDVQLCKLEKKELQLVQGATREQAWSDPDAQEWKLKSVPSCQVHLLQLLITIEKEGT